MANLKDLIVNGCARVVDTIYGKLGYGITIQTNGTSQGTFNNTENKTINITPANIGASASGHTHSNYLTAHQSLAGYVPTSRTVNGKALSANISLTASDVGASASGHTHNYAPSSGSTNYLTKLAWWNNGDTHDVDTLKTGCTFAYTSHKAVTTGTIVAFSCTNNNYTLQLQGSYNSNILYFRNHNGDKGVWQSWKRLWGEGDAITGAVYNDYAELFPRIAGDNETSTEAGDIIAYDCTDGNEGYRKASKNDDFVVGVHSNEWGHLIGGEQPTEDKSYLEYNLPKYIPVALAGRVWVNIKPNTKAELKDYVIPSDMLGKGVCVKEWSHNIVGRVVALDLEHNKVRIVVQCR